MSRDFILILAGGMVSLLTTLVVLYASDYIFRRDELLYRKSLPPPPMYTQPALGVMDEPQMLAEDNASAMIEENAEEHAPAVTATEAKSDM
jgi:hypothetical protein